MSSIEYVEMGEAGLECIAPLWKKLNAMHTGQGSAFSEIYRKKKFDERAGEIITKVKGKTLLVHVAKDTGTGEIVGYCVSIAGNGEGEVESLYVDERYRALGIGDVFMKRAISWMDTFSVHTKKIIVYAGNEGVLKFYQRYGFRPRHIVLEYHDSVVRPT
jgi:GNAT superfamily N-acetyltransferase